MPRVSTTPPQPSNEPQSLSQQGLAPEQLQQLERMQKQLKTQGRLLRLENFVLWVSLLPVILGALFVAAIVILVLYAIIT